MPEEDIGNVQQAQTDNVLKKEQDQDGSQFKKVNKLAESC
jgi:hypothetical protein